MRLAIICRPVVPYGGLETATAGLLSELARQGHDLHLFSPPRPRPLPGMTHHRLLVLPRPSLARLLSLVLAARVAVRHGFDVVQSHERTLSQDIYRAGEGCHRAYLRIKAQGLTPMHRAALQMSPYHRMLLALERRLFTSGATRKIVAISHGSAEEIRRLYGVPESQIAVIYNGVDQERFDPDNRPRFRPALRTELGIPPEAWVVLFVGSGFERKGLAPLIEGFARISDRSARLIVVGKGNPTPYRTLARRLGLEGRVMWTGLRSDVERCYATADLVALPARYEPFGNVHLEALASGLPVLASTRSGGAEVVSHGETGWIVDEPEDPEAIARGLRALRDIDSTRVSDLARRAVKPFTFAAQVDALTKLYRSL
ncbi:MAG: glycosyltransferase family 4 protein [Candidatus Methylomirabilia bacterium]